MTASRANRWVAIGVVGLVVAVVVWLASDGTDSRRANVAGGEPSARARDRAVVESVASSPVGDEQGATDPRSADSTVAAPALDLVTIHGRVVHADGSPAGDAIVRLRTGIPDLDYAELVERRAGPPKLDRSARTRRIAAYAQARGGWERAFATRSRIDGTFRLEVPRELAVFTLVARRGDESFDCGEPFDLSPSRVAEGFLLPLESAGTIAGTILGADGKPVADARVEATDCSMINGAEFMFARGYVERSDGEGRFAFRALPRGDWSVEASAPGCQEAKAEVTLARGATARVDLRLGHGEVIEGRVIDGSGAPVAGALVFGSITDAEGRFRVDNVAPGRHRLTIFHDDGWEALVDGAYPKVEIPRPAGAPPIVLVLERGRRMSGRVVDGAGRGLAHVIVNVSPSGWGFEVWSPKPGKHSTIRVVETDSDGRFHAGGLADGPFRVVATLENVASIEKTVASADPAFVELVMPATTGISGRVVDAVDRSPIEGFRVYAYPSEQGLGVYLDQRESRTFSAPDGRFDLLGLSPGVYSVRAITDGRPEASSAEVVVESGKIAPNVVVELPRGTTIRGLVIDRLDGAPLSRAAVMILRKDGKSGDRPPARTLADGSFELRGIDPGTLQIGAVDGEHVGATSEPVEARAGETTTMSPLALDRGGTIEGTVRDSNGEPLRRHTVSAGAGASDAERDALPAWRGARLADDGSFRITGLRSGAWELSVTRESDDPIVASATVREGQTTHVDLVGSPENKLRCRIVGRVIRADHPIEGAFVTMVVDPASAKRARGSSLEWFAATDDEGAFTIENARPGPVVCDIVTGGVTHVRRFEVPEAQRHEITIELPRGGAVRGRVLRRSAGTPIPDAPVYAEPISAKAVAGAAYSATDAQGRFAFEDLPPGAYWISTSPTGSRGAERFAPRAKRLELTADRTADVDLAVDDGASVVVEVLRADGKPAGGCTVRIHPPESIWATDSADAGGFARFDAVASGDCHVAAWMDGVPHVVSDPIRIEAGREIRVRLQFPPGEALRVRATDAGGRAVSIDHVAATDSRGHVVGSWWKPAEPTAVADVVVPRGKLRIGVDSPSGSGSADVEVGDSPAEIVIRVGEPPKSGG